MSAVQVAIAKATREALAGFAAERDEWVSADSHARYAVLMAGMTVETFGERTVLVRVPAGRDGVLWGYAAGDALDRGAQVAPETLDGNIRPLSGGRIWVFTW